MPPLPVWLRPDANISVWMDNQLISVIYTRNEPVEPVITGEFTADSAIRLAAEINARSLPLSLTAEDFSVISPGPRAARCSPPSAALPVWG